ncbi:MAG: ParB N-terminal domain-containing protein [Acidobacteria bacterium]|nr:ParB N-terminal domain-containing protein [Acidobacteriota bacterium]
MPLKEYGYRQGELLIVGDAGAGCVTRWLVTDQVGTPRILADATGSLAGISRHDYLPFGEELTAGYGGRTNAQGYTGDCVRDKFVGYERDAETGLDYAEARYHGSVYGRFTSVDPAMGSARKSMPQSWNRYTYVMNQPLSLIDPTGEFWVGKNLAGGGSHLFRVEGSGKQATPDERKYWEGEGYTVYEDGAIIGFEGGGTFEERLWNWEPQVVLGADGEKRTLRSILGAQLSGEMLLLYARAGIEGRGLLVDLAIDRFFPEEEDAPPPVGAAMTMGNITDAGSEASTVETLRPGNLEPTHEVRANARLKNLITDIEQNGIQEPIKYAEHNGTKYVVDGHHRLAAASHLGLNEVPAQRVQLPHKGYKDTVDLTKVTWGRFRKALRWLKRL